MLNQELNGLANNLLRDGMISKEDITIMSNATNQEFSIVSALVKNNILSSKVILDYCEKKFALPIFDLRYYDAALLYDNVITLEFICRYRVLPLHRDQNHLYLGITDPTDYKTISTVSFHTGLRVRPMLVSESELNNIINAHCRPAMLDSKLQLALSKLTSIEEPLAVLPAENKQQDEEPVIEFVNRLIQDALIKQATDIHIEHYEKNSRIRFRRDGLLSETTTLSPALSIRVITRLKIMANLNIAERRLPQDGRIYLTDIIGDLQKIDIRINVCPTVYGEKVVMRLLDTQKLNLDLDELGFSDTQKKLFLQKIEQPVGLILLSGPTGSGKTVTLYSALNYINRIEKNISSVEDPVEISLHGINQVNINPQIGLNFANVLRTFLRQDPDILMIGEIRDNETAHIAIQAAQTGHLVMSTIHANNALEIITRLQAMEVQTYNFLQTSPLLMAQRLVRKLCIHCKQQEDNPSPHLLPIISSPVYRAVGCEYCYLGYKGQTAIFELISVSDAIAQQILTNTSTGQILQYIKNAGAILLYESGLQKVKQGITSYAELMRVLGSDLHV